MKLNRITIPYEGDALPAVEIGYSASTTTLTLKKGDEPSFDVNIATLLAAPGTRDCSAFAVYEHGRIVNVLASTYESKETPSEFLANQRSVMGEEVLAYIIVPVEADITTVSLRVALEDSRTVTVTGDLIVKEIENRRFIAEFPTVTFGTPTTTDSVMSVPVTASASVDLYFESSLGVVLTPYLNGSGNVLVSLASLPAGATGRLKANFRYWSSVTSIDITS